MTITIKYTLAVWRGPAGRYSKVTVGGAWRLDSRD